MSTGGDFGKRLKAARVVAGVSINKLAEELGITASAISHLEAGRSKSLTAARTFEAARVLGVSPEWLATGRKESQEAAS